MASFTKRKKRNGSISHIAQVRRVGHPPLTRAFPTKLAAELWATQTEHRIAAGGAVGGETMTFADLLTEVEPKLTNPYAAALAYWRQHFGPLKLAKVTPALIDVHRDRLLGAPCKSHKQKTERPRTPATVWQYLQQLSVIFSTADRELHLIDFNPVARVRRPSLPRGRDRFLSDEELGRLLDACRSSDSPWIYPFVLFLVTTGARRGEAYGLRWDHIDVERRWARFPMTKNGTARGVPLTQAVLDAVMALPRAPDAELVFPEECTRRAWNTALKRAGIENFRLHDLRHSAASFLVRDGASLFEVGRLLGHRDARMTDRYSHLAKEQTAALVDRVMADVK